MYPCMLSSIPFSVGLGSSSQKTLVLVILHRCGWIVASSSGQTTLVWCCPTWSSHLPTQHPGFGWILFALIFLLNGRTFWTVLHRWSDDCFEEFVFQFYGHLPIAHHPRYFLPLHPLDSYPVVDISMWTSLTREQWPDVFEGCHCWQFSINKVYSGFCIICGAWPDVLNMTIDLAATDFALAITHVLRDQSCVLFTISPRFREKFGLSLVVTWS